MARRFLESAHVGLATALIGIAVLGCDKSASIDKPASETTSTETKSEGGGGKSASAVLGTYENANDKLTIHLKPDNKVTMSDEGKPRDLNWEMDGAGKVVIHGQDGVNLLFTVNSDGNLSDGQGGVFRKK